MDHDDLLFSITSHASQRTQLFLLRSPVSPSTSFFSEQHLQRIQNFSSSAYQINISLAISSASQPL